MALFSRQVRSSANKCVGNESVMILALHAEDLDKRSSTTWSSVLKQTERYRIAALCFAVPEEIIDVVNACKWRLNGVSSAKTLAFRRFSQAKRRS